MERKPGRPRALTVDVIAQAALDDGIATFSMPSVARRLGVAHSGLYRYVVDRDDLLMQATERAMRSVPWPSTHADDWRELITAIGEAVWNVCDTYPGLDRASMSSLRPAPTLITLLDGFATAMHEMGFTIEDAAVAVDSVMTLATDSSLTMSRIATMKALEQERGTSYEFPRGFNTTEVLEGRGTYDRKLQILLDGLSHRVTETSQT